MFQNLYWMFVKPLVQFFVGFLILLGNLSTYSRRFLNVPSHLTLLHLLWRIVPFFHFPPGLCAFNQLNPSITVSWSFLSRKVLWLILTPRFILCSNLTKYTISLHTRPEGFASVPKDPWKLPKSQKCNMSSDRIFEKSPTKTKYHEIIRPKVKTPRYQHISLIRYRLKSQNGMMME